LSSVGEVIVSGGHVMEGVGDVHLDETAVEVRLSGIQFETVLHVLFGVVTVGVQSGLGLAIGLIQPGHSHSETSLFEEEIVGTQPRVGGGDIARDIGQLNHIGSIGLVGTLTGISSRICVTTSPLEVDVIPNKDGKCFRDKIIFGAGYVSTIFPLFPRTFKLKILAVL